MSDQETASAVPDRFRSDSMPTPDRSAVPKSFRSATSADVSRVMKPRGPMSDQETQSAESPEVLQWLRDNAERIDLGAEIKLLCEKLGVVTQDVMHITLSPVAAEVILVRRNEYGNAFLENGEVATSERSFKIRTA